MPEIRAGDSSSPALIQPELLPETLDGSSPVSQIEVIDVDPLASMPEIADGSLQYSPLKTLGNQSSETCLLSPPGSSSSVAPQSPDLQEVLQVEPLSPSPFNLVGNSLPDYELNPQSEPTGPWRWSSRWASSSSTKESEILSDFPFPIEDSELSAAVGAGLSNMGNTCFINAILQCFTHTVPLVEGLRSCNHSKPCECASERFCVFCALRDHVDLSIASSGRVIRPWKLVNNLNYFSSYFQRYQQEDAHEFLQCFLDKLERSCLDSMEKTDTSCVQDKNLVEKVFGGRLQSKLRCCNCGHCSDTYEPLIDLSLEIEDVDSLPKALESFTKIEKINDLETKFTCDSCKEQVSVEKQLVLDQAPPVAAFHLKRFKTDGTHVEKIEKHVEFPLELDLKPYSSCSGSNVELKYELYAIVEHVGFSSTSGHYFCFIRSSPGTWHRLDDSKVTRVQEEFVLSQEAYILFYARQGTPWFSSIMEAEKPCLDPAILNTSPKSVLENVDSISNLSPSVMNVDCCTANVRRDAHERISLSLRQARQEEVEVVDTSDAASGPSEQNIASMDYIAAVTGASTPAGVSNSVNGASNNNGRCTTSSLGGNNSHKKYAKVVLLPTTPPRSRSPDVPYESPEPIYRLPRDQSKSADNVSCKRSLNDAIRGDHLKSADNVSCKRQSINSLGDPKRIEAFRYLQKNSLTRGRGSQLLAAMAGTQGSFNKKRKIAGSSPCKRVNPAGGSHKSTRTVRPMAAALR